MRFAPFVVLLLVLLAVSLVGQAQTTTNFTYQGYLEDGGVPANGTYDLYFQLYDLPTLGTQQGTNRYAPDTVVTNGQFTVLLDWGYAVFPGAPRFLQIYVRPGASTGAYTKLNPRQQLTPVPYALAALNAWRLGGNGFTTAGANFLGTLDDQALELKVNNLRALRLEPNTSSPRLLGGYYGNVITPGFAGAVIAGGGNSFEINQVNNEYAAIVGGVGNTASGANSFIGSGRNNTASGNRAMVGGGFSNICSGSWATIGAGYQNTASGEVSTVGGGEYHQATGYGAFIGGGSNNSATATNTTIAGGSHNAAGGAYATVAGGSNNTASGQYATVAGGTGNTASGLNAFVAGGTGNTASGENSFAGGKGALANIKGSFVWLDSATNDSFGGVVNENEVFIRGSGGFYFWTSTLGVGAKLESGSGTWTSFSDRNGKTDITALEPRAVLNKLMAIPISRWRYKTEADGVFHYGPMAQDFYAAFQLGHDDKGITTVDADGVAFAAIQGLYQVVKERDAEIAALKKKAAEVDDLKTRLAALEALVQKLAAPQQPMGGLK